MLALRVADGVRDSDAMALVRGFFSGLQRPSSLVSVTTNDFTWFGRAIDHATWAACTAGPEVGSVRVEVCERFAMSDADGSSIGVKLDGGEAPFLVTLATEQGPQAILAVVRLKAGALRLARLVSLAHALAA